MVDNISKTTPLPCEKAFADFFAEYMIMRYDAAQLSIKRNKGDFENLDLKQLQQIYKTFSDIMPDQLPETIDIYTSESEDLDECAERYIEFNDEGELFVKLIKQIDMVMSKEKEITPQEPTTPKER